jgi:PAS domain S-box-containing protein/excisionase family DNA binding protein
MALTARPPRPDTDPPAHSAEPQHYYSISQAAALLGVSRMSISRWIRDGRLPVARLGHRTARIRREDLEHLLTGDSPPTSSLQVVPAGALVSPAQGGPETSRTPGAGWSEIGQGEHFVQFYEADAVLVAAVADYIGAALRANEAGIVIATAAHREAVEARLRADGLDVDGALAGGRYVALDAAETLARFIVHGEPEPGRFAEVVGSVVGRLAEGGRPVRAFGEMVALLAAEGSHAAAIQLEALWNGLQQVHTFALLCAYPVTALGGEALAAVFDDVCAEHARVIPAESYSGLADPDARLRAIAALQRKAAALETEVAERRRVEERLRESERELRDFIENATEGLHWVGPDGRILWANRAELELLGYAAEDYIGHHIAEFHVDPEVIDDILRRLSSDDELHGYEARMRAKDGSIKHVLINSNVYRQGGRFVHTRCFTRDITERKLAEQEREELLTRELATKRRLSLLAEAGRALASSLDYEATLGAVVRLALPTLGDFGFFDVVEDDEVRRIPYAPGDPHTQALLDGTRWVRSERTDLNLCALSSGVSGMHAEITDAWLEDVATSPEHLALMRQLGFRSMLTVPLAYQGRLLGALTLFCGASGRRYTDEDLALAEELASRAAAAVANATSLEEARQAINLRDEFLSVASHELRTPLATLSGHAQLALRRLSRDGYLEPERVAHALDTIIAQSEKLSRLVGQLLDISRLQAGKLALERRPTDLAALVQQVVADAQARSDRHTVTLAAPEILESAFDSLRLEQVFCNLLDNAIKYSPGGGRIEVMLARHGPAVAELSVRDHGLGIPPDKRGRIFERFYQAHGEGHRSGLGLGLFISRQIVELHGGEIWAEFPDDGGARFVVRLPLTA